MDAQERSGSPVWDVPYLSIDPKDVGRSYEAIIRVNSQSGKGGVAYLMAAEHNLELPRGLQVDFARRVQQITDARGGELTGDELLAAFTEHYLDHTQPYELLAYTHSSEEDSDQIAARVRVDGEERVIEGEGNGPLVGARRRFRQGVRRHDLAPRLPRAHDGRERRRAGGGVRGGRRRRRGVLGRRRARLDPHRVAARDRQRGQPRGGGEAAPARPWWRAGCSHGAKQRLHL